MAGHHDHGQMRPARARHLGELTPIDLARDMGSVAKFGFEGGVQKWI